MSEPIWCNVKVKIPTSWNGPDEQSRWGAPGEMVPGTPPIIEQLAHALINGDLGSDVEGDCTIWNASGEGNYGLYDDDVEAALSWLQEHAVPFEAISDTKYDMVGEYRLFDGRTTHGREYNEGITLCQRDWQFILEAETPAGSDKNAAVVAAVDAYFRTPDLAGCDISNLPERYPSEDEDDEDT